MSNLIGIFGGTFDPVHLGHINSINMLSMSVEFDRVHWVLSARPPHKDSIATSVDHRFEMLKRALSDYPNYQVDDCEITRIETSYTFDTIQDFRERFPKQRLCLIIGADSFLNLHTWHRYQELIEQVHIIVMSRPGYELELPEYITLQQTVSINQIGERKEPSIAVFHDSHFDISSTRIRSIFHQIAKKSNKQQESELRLKLKKIMPVSVFDYIQQQQNYTLPPQNFENKMKPEKIKNQVVEALEDIKGKDIRVIDIKDISDFADYMIVVSGTSDTHVRALARAASTKLRQQGVIPLGENGADIGEWILVDFGDVVLHVMRPEVREYYDLEKLWDEDVRELVKKHREQSDSNGASD